MKRFTYNKLRALEPIVLSVILIFLAIAIPFKTFAGDISMSSDSVEVAAGKNTTIKLVGNNVAGLCSVASADENICTAEMEGEGWIEDEELKIVIHGNALGSTTVYVNYQVGDFDDEEALYEGTFEITVLVNENSGGSVTPNDSDASADTEQVNTEVESNATPTQTQIQTQGQGTAVTGQKQSSTVNEKSTEQTKIVTENSEEEQSESPVVLTEKIEKNEKTAWPVIVIALIILLVIIVAAYVIVRVKRSKKKRRSRRRRQSSK